jgi:hypothetical protein
MDFSSLKVLAQYVHAYNSDTTKYKSFLKHKLGEDSEKITSSRLINAPKLRKWGIDDDFEQGNFIEHFECFVCEQEHKKLNGEKTKISRTSKAHYNCPIPVSYRNKKNWWVDQWCMG